MSRKIANRRSEVRAKVPAFVELKIRFATLEGVQLSLPLTDLSPSNALFKLPRRVEGLVVGSTIPNAEILSGKISLRVTIEVVRLTRTALTSYDCGVRLYPATPDDFNELVALFSRAAALPE